MTTVRSGITVNSPLNYVYDDLYRLVEATNPINSTPETFVYDSVGNRLRKTGQVTDSIFDNANALNEDADYTYTYDNNGNMIEKFNKTTSEITQYTYDAENRLIQVTKPGMTAAYRYDALGRRIEKNINGTATRYIYDRERIYQEFDASNTMVASFRFGPGIDDHIGRAITGAGFAFYQDGLGNVTEVLDGAGAILQSYVYDAFGNIVLQNGTAFNPYFSYTGREYDAESGLYYYRARYYDPTIGRFLSEDPIGLYGGDVNFYTYVRDNPTTYIDPFGREIVIPFPEPLVIPRPIPIPFPLPRPVPIPVPVIPLPDDDLTDHCTKLYVLCIDQRWGGDWRCDECHFYCTGINKEWPYEHCSKDLACK
jgi:RHS repeat-associated protein